MSKAERGMSGFAEAEKALQLQGIRTLGYGQSYPHQNPQAMEYRDDPLGTPLSIRDVARLIGCSVWTVRQRYLPHGMPHLRSGSRGKLIFFRDQVIRWVIAHQQKGGTSK